jgi:hypothetical protein
MGFADSVRASASKMQEQVNNKINTAATELFYTIVRYTPRSLGDIEPAGKLANNWYLGKGVGRYNKSYSKTPDVMATNSVAEVVKVKSLREFVGKDGEVSFTNSTPYAIRAELIGWPRPVWTGTVGPYAMVRKALIEVAPKYK